MHRGGSGNHLQRALDIVNNPCKNEIERTRHDNSGGKVREFNKMDNIVNAQENSVNLILITPIGMGSNLVQGTMPQT